jgi:NADH:ubiquinone oxidoreductase subunit F (NADH-binding)
MKRDQIIEMAKQAEVAGPFISIPSLERFAWLAADHALEEAAKVAMEFRRGAGDPVCGEVAAAIRAMKGKP